ncbi:MAG: DUF1588 domain-containing protein [Planctomycetia bacterium]|nr:DUF1588 domain-containing protein [Planctomycetia bacterium]
MIPRRSSGVLAAVLVAATVPAVRAADEEHARLFKPFLTAHCVRCHGPEKQSGDFRVDDLTGDPAKDADRLLAIREQIRAGLMPPGRETRPDPADVRAIIAWTTVRTGGLAGRQPGQGNLIPHELLFGKPAPTAAATPGRLWRLSPDGYLGFLSDLGKNKALPGIVQPFTLEPERGIKDFAGLYTIDEPSTEILLRNAELIVEGQTARQNGVREFVVLMDPASPPTRAQLEAAVAQQFKMALGRTPGADDVTRFLGLYERCLKVSDSPGAVKTMLQAVLLRTDAMFRSELGKGTDAGGRRLLAPDELAAALSLALGDRREAGIMLAAQKGELATREQAAVHVRRLLDDPKFDKTRILKFFREYFDYANALTVFKDKPKTFVHEPRQLVADTDRLVLHIVAADKDVFRQLLTTEVSFVNYAVGKNKQTNQDEGKPGVVLNPNNNKGQQGIEETYGLDRWPAEQPAKLPDNSRLGILMQPSWLVAYSTNFDNDPVRRGRWVRDRLLGGSVPELPIGVAAQVPNDPHRTFRERLTVTRDARCWKCHSKMDELGLPFEQFDHFGRFRTTETVLDLEATEKNVDKKGKSLGPVTREAVLNTAGTIADSGDAKLDGPVKDPRAMIRKLADSERCRQVFVRHAFRFYLGRNETLADAKTLQDADRAYVESGGSFKALLVSLLTSDAFLYRSVPVASTTTTPGGSR